MSDPRTVLVTGGAGYIGSHTVVVLLDAGWRVVVIDNLDNSSEVAIDRVRELTGAGDDRLVFVRGDIRDGADLDRAFGAGGVEAVVHFAGRKAVGESVEHPLWYYDHNVTGTMRLLEAMQRHGVRDLVFSSSCTVYGEPEGVPITEGMRLGAQSPYGRTKLIGEQMLQDVAAALSARDAAPAMTSLRYFNVAGCEPAGELGEDHDPELHLIPVVLRTALGLQPSLKLFGEDYPTPDGTCVRDYVHVCDIAAAHVLALEKVSPGETVTLNLGIGRGISNREILEAARKVTGREIRVESAPRRPGDPARLFASPLAAERTLGWKPCFTQLEQIIETAWKWFQAHPRGYRA